MILTTYPPSTNCPINIWVITKIYQRCGKSSWFFFKLFTDRNWAVTMCLVDTHNIPGWHTQCTRLTKTYLVDTETTFLVATHTHHTWLTHTTQMVYTHNVPGWRTQWEYCEQTQVCEAKQQTRSNAGPSWLSGWHHSDSETMRLLNQWQPVSPALYSEGLAISG